MAKQKASPAELLKSLWRNRSLVRALVAREVIGRYRGSALGVLWSLFNPILMLAVYTFVFSVVFKARWSGEGESRSQFALALFIGLIVFNIFAECVNRAPGLVLSNANYVKKVIFPLEVLPPVALGAALFHAAVSVLVWIAFFVITVGAPHPQVLALPVVALPLMLLVAGLSWVLASLGVYLRDVGQVVGLLTTALMFLSPIFYPASALPEFLKSYLFLNPLAPNIEMVRNLMMWGQIPEPVVYMTSLVVGGTAALAGFAWFQKTRGGFADVL
jgi:lipopolysaccharide transport system permease protein